MQDLQVHPTSPNVLKVIMAYSPWRMSTCYISDGSLNDFYHFLNDSFHSLLCYSVIDSGLIFIE